MNENVNKNALFYGSCFALITTGLSYIIRAGILEQLGEEFSLSAEQLGYINAMWFFGFPISMVIGGLVYHSVGPPQEYNESSFRSTHIGSFADGVCYGVRKLTYLYVVYRSRYRMYRSSL